MIGVAPVHVPLLAVSVLPTAAVPLIAGGTVLSGPAGAVIFALGALVAVDEPSELLAITTTLFYFLWRARAGWYWAFRRLQLFSRIFPIVALVLAAIPGLYPFWVVTEQILFAILLIGVSDYLQSDVVRAAYPKPRR